MFLTWAAKGIGWMSVVEGLIDWSNIAIKNRRKKKVTFGRCRKCNSWRVDAFNAMSCIQSDRQEVRSLSFSFPEFPNATVVSSSLDDWVSCGATGFHSLKVARLGASVQQLISRELPAPLLLRLLHYLADAVARWVGVAGVSQGRRWLCRDRPAKFFPELQLPSAGQSAALHCLPYCKAVLCLAILPFARKVCPLLSEIFRRLNKLTSVK